MTSCFNYWVGLGKNHVLLDLKVAVFCPNRTQTRLFRLFVKVREKQRSARLQHWKPMFGSLSQCFVPILRFRLRTLLWTTRLFSSVLRQWVEAGRVDVVKKELDKRLQQTKASELGSDIFEPLKLFIFSNNLRLYCQFDFGNWSKNVRTQRHSVKSQRIDNRSNNWAFYSRTKIRMIEKWDYARDTPKQQQQKTMSVNAVPIVPLWTVSNMFGDRTPACHDVLFSTKIGIMSASADLTKLERMLVKNVKKKRKCLHHWRNYLYLPIRTFRTSSDQNSI